MQRSRPLRDKKISSLSSRSQASVRRPVEHFSVSTHTEKCSTGRRTLAWDRLDKELIFLSRNGRLLCILSSAEIQSWAGRHERVLVMQPPKDRLGSGGRQSIAAMVRIGT